jgi:hypothetical protein
MLLNQDPEGADGDALGDGEHERGARGDLTEKVASGGNDADPVDVRPSGMDLEVQAFFFEEAELLRDHFSELVSPREPAELHVEEVGPSTSPEASAEDRATAGAVSAGG